jgi:hypothetical protein
METWNGDLRQRRNVGKTGKVVIPEFEDGYRTAEKSGRQCGYLNFTKDQVSI